MFIAYNQYVNRDMLNLASGQIDLLCNYRQLVEKNLDGYDSGAYSLPGTYS